MAIALLNVSATTAWWTLILIILVGLLLLSWGGDALARGASAAARRLAINPLVIGLTIVSVATSMPEMVTCLISAANGAPNLAVGNIIGSNIGNIGLILGIAALILPLSVQNSVLRYEVPTLAGVTLVFTLLCLGDLQRWEGILMLVMTVSYLAWLLKRSGRMTPEEKKVFLAEVPSDRKLPNIPRSMALVIGGGLSLWLGAEAVFLSAVEMAERLHISEFIIGLTIIAIGTSLPELAASVAAALRKEADLITGNIVGSNLFNMLLIGGTVGTVTPFDVHSSFFRFEFPAMLALTLLLWIQVISQKTITRSEAVLLLAVYGGILGMSAWIQSPM